ncbi:MAG TPA: FecR domain-containing protein, partial [Puia sp.]|nr:FecR domain-containing protein [Puia sp.]
ELLTIMAAYETSYGKWVFPIGPSAEWMSQLEGKLDAGVDLQEVPMPTVMDDRRPMVPWKSWMKAAAVVAVLLAGTYLYVHQGGRKPSDIKDREKLLAMVISNARGAAQKEIVLEDGSKVWLNAGSVLKYPPHFTGSERVVELSGEAFFDVTGSSQHPFKVLIGDAEVDVLGTYFAIMAYDDEPASRTTLVDGALKIVIGQKELQLMPGDEVAVIHASQGVGAATMRNSGVDPKVVRAWQHGIYMFKRKELREVMRELERVYDVTVQYQPNVGNPPINGNLDLNKGLDIVLKQLEGSVSGEKINFRHEGKTIIASSAS